ncbi:MAG TPA: CDP-alcohol phosphatidyltransferase family protein [Candidatus Paceibacterota bacterium]|nr:CDP-alcohol phosphatidyltransferase family protein [Candidatus Paceibacterota bacterium]
MTFSRIAFIPFLIMGELQEKYFQSLMIILLISMSDIVDGMVAKQVESSCKGGDIFDIAADFMVVLSVFVLWYLKQMVSIYIIFLILLSFITFGYISFLKKKITKNKIGKYVGAVCFLGITVIIFTRLYFKKIYISSQNLVVIIISIYLIISIIENIRSIIKEIRYEQKR